MTWSAPYPSKLFKYISENDAKYVAFSIRSDGDGSIAKHIVNMIICPIKALVDEHMQQAQNLDREYFRFFGYPDKAIHKIKPLLLVQ